MRYCSFGKINLLPPPLLLLLLPLLRLLQCCAIEWSQPHGWCMKVFAFCEVLGFWLHCLLFVDSGRRRDDSGAFLHQVYWLDELSRCGQRSPQLQIQRGEQGQVDWYAGLLWLQPDGQRTVVPVRTGRRRLSATYHSYCRQRGSVQHVVSYQRYSHCQFTSQFIQPV